MCKSSYRKNSAAHSSNTTIAASLATGRSNLKNNVPVTNKGAAASSSSSSSSATNMIQQQQVEVEGEGKISKGPWRKGEEDDGERNP